MKGTRIRNVLLLLLACTAGGVDALSYVGLGRVFTANMTGNTVLLGLALGQAELQAVVRSGLALTGFLAGVALGAWTTNRGLRGSIWTPAVTAALTMEWLLLAAWAVGWYSRGLETNQLVRDALIMVSALAMGIQSAVGTSAEHLRGRNHLYYRNAHEPDHTPRRPRVHPAHISSRP